MEARPGTPARIRTSMPCSFPERRQRPPTLIRGGAGSESPGLHISQSNSHLPSVGRPILLDAFVLQCVVAEIRAIVFTLWNIGSDTQDIFGIKKLKVLLSNARLFSSPGIVAN